MSERHVGDRLWFDQMTSPQLAEYVSGAHLVILPFGSIEEHGSHLPLGTDSFQCESIVKRVAAAFGALVLPPIRYGECRTTRRFPGTISLRSETVRAIAEDVMMELARNGVVNVLVLSGHAGSGHMAAIKLGAQGAVERDSRLKVMVLSDCDIAYELAGEEFPANDGHAGQVETSRMLAIRPDLVGDDRPVGESRPPKFMILKDPERYIPTGVMGDPRGASEDKGRRIDDYVVGKLCEMIAENFGLPAKATED
ncbi:MAG: creatininase family protein [Methanobacteriota archaeon]|nr:MAG: creatininase family protein [Euryarchaeota archaeon]